MSYFDAEVTEQLPFFQFESATIPLYDAYTYGYLPRGTSQNGLPTIQVGLSYDHLRARGFRG